MGGRFEACKHHQASGFSRTGGPEHREKLALSDREIEIFHDERLAVVALLNMLEGYECPLAGFGCHVFPPITGGHHAKILCEC